MTIKAIETVYNGYRFRSRLEARWAVFFDAMGIKYEYELQGYDLDGVWYLPDFWLPPPHNCFIEIKPPRQPTSEEIQKAGRLAMLHPVALFTGTPTTPVVTSDLMGLEKGSYALMFAQAFSPKHPEDKHTMLCPRPYCWMERKEDGSLILWPVPHWEPVEPGKEEPAFQYCMGLPKKDGGTAEIWLYPPFYRKSIDSPRLRQAYKAARQARFEHGETPG